MRTNLATIVATGRELCEIFAGLLLILAAGFLFCMLEVYALKVCIDGLRKPACIRYCPPPIPAGDTLHLNLGDLPDTIHLGDDHFCSRCYKDFPDWDEDSITFPFW